MSSNFTVIYGACVLYPPPLRDLLMRLALTDLYRARWTDMIDHEWTRNVLKDRPDLKVLYMSGYIENLEPGLNFLEKPFTSADLLKRIRAAFNGMT